MDNLKKYGVELVIAFWLLVVAVQYISTYFFPLGLDFMPVYYAMFAFVAGASVIKNFVVRPSSNVNREQSLETTSVDDRRIGGRKSRRSRR